MLNNDHLQLAIANHEADDEEEMVREIHALTPPRQPPRLRSSASSLSVASTPSSENFTSMSREFSALVLAGSSMADQFREDSAHNNPLAMIGEEDDPPPYRETNPLAIVPDTAGGVSAASASPRRAAGGSSSSTAVRGEATVEMVKREEVETKISAWQTAKIAKINNRFKREDAIINGWENEEVQKATSWMKKVERKLEEKRAKAVEKMENDIAKARRKAEERRASAEGKRGTKVAAVVELANLMRAVGRPPVKRSFF